MEISQRHIVELLQQAAANPGGLAELLGALEPFEVLIMDDPASAPHIRIAAQESQGRIMMACFTSRQIMCEVGLESASYLTIPFTELLAVASKHGSDVAVNLGLTSAWTLLHEQLAPLSPSALHGGELH